MALKIVVRKLISQLGYELAPDAAAKLKAFRSQATLAAREVTGTYRDANGRLRDAKGRFLAAGQAGAAAGSQIEAGGEKAARGMQRASSSAFDLGGALEHVLQVTAGLAVLGLGALARGLVEANVEFENLNASLITVTGSEESAAAAFQQLEGFAARTPFSLNEVTAAFIKLKALGLDPSEAALESYGNTASAMGKSLSDFIEAVADASTGEFERLKEFGIKASSQGNKVSFTFRGVTTTVGKNAAEIEAYLRGIGQNEFAGGMARQAQTLAGMWSTLKDNMGGFFRTIGRSGFNAGLKVLLQTLLDLSGGGQELGQVLGAALGKGLIAAAQLLRWVKDNTVWIKRAAAAAALLLSPFLGVVFVVQDLITYLRGGSSVLGAWLDWAEEQGGALGELAGWARGALDALRGFALQLAALMRGESVDGWMGRALALAQRFITFVRTDGVAGLSRLWEAAKPLGQQLARVFNALFEQASRVFAALRPLLQRFGADFSGQAEAFDTSISLLVFGLQLLTAILTRLVDMVVLFGRASTFVFETTAKLLDAAITQLAPYVALLERAAGLFQRVAGGALGGALGSVGEDNLIQGVTSGIFGGPSPALLSAAGAGGVRGSTTNQQASIGQVVVNQQFAQGDPATAAAGLGGALKGAASDALGGLMRDLGGG